MIIIGCGCLIDILLVLFAIIVWIVKGLGIALLLFLAFLLLYGIGCLIYTAYCKLRGRKREGPGLKERIRHYMCGNKRKKKSE